MKKYLSKLLKFVSVFAVCAMLLEMVAAGITVDNNPVKKQKSEIIIKYKDEVIGQSTLIKMQGKISKKLAVRNGVTARSMVNKRMQSIKVDDSKSIEEIIDLLNELPEVEYAVPNYDLIINGYDEPGMNQQWGLDAIHIEPVWELADGDEVIVAIIDTGIDISHEDLKDNIFVNTKEIAGNGIDDDNNGFIDDINGWNFGIYENIIFQIFV